MASAVLSVVVTPHNPAEGASRREMRYVAEPMPIHGASPEHVTRRRSLLAHRKQQDREWPTAVSRSNCRQRHDWQ